MGDRTDPVVHPTQVEFFLLDTFPARSQTANRMNGGGDSSLSQMISFGWFDKRFDQIDLTNKLILKRIDDLEMQGKLILFEIKKLGDVISNPNPYVIPELEEQIKKAGGLSAAIDIKVPDRSPVPPDPALSTP